MGSEGGIKRDALSKRKESLFNMIDADGSGMIRRAELRRWLAGISKSIPDQVISGLISYVDTDGARTVLVPRAVPLPLCGGHDMRARLVCSDGILCRQATPRPCRSLSS